MTAEQKLSKIETLRMAQAYIKTLASLVQADTMGGPADIHLLEDEKTATLGMTTDSNSSSGSIDTVEIDMFELINQG